MDNSNIALDDIDVDESPMHISGWKEALKYIYCNNSNFSALPICNNSIAPSLYDDAKILQRLVGIIVPILFSLIVVIGLFGNALVVTVVAGNKHLRSTTNFLIINLAIADLLFIIFCVPFTATDYVLTSWPFGDIWCKIVQYLIVVTAYASVYTLVLMSLDRFLAVVHPIQSMSIRTEQNALIAIVLTWFVILLSSVPVYISHGEISYDFDDQWQTACYFLEYDPLNRPDGYNKPAFQVTFFATSYVIPLALICGLYLCMLMRLWRGVAPGGHVSAESRRGKKRVTRMVVIVVVIFAVCWFPIQIILVLKSLQLWNMNNTTVMVQIVSQVLAYMNSCVNPILYAYLSENFRKAFRKVIYCVPKSRRCVQNGRLENEKSETRALTTKTTKTNGTDIL